jgi:hypothetical protein
MGNQRARREEFFRAHPTCCFCGGSTAAITEDHIPARSLFRNKQWPQSYVFPACSYCNKASSLDELVLGWLVRAQLGIYAGDDKKEFQSALEKFQRRRPEWFAKMKEMTRTETRQHLRSHSLSASDFPGGEIYGMTLPEEITDALDRYAKKLGKALYYLHTQRIVPSSGVVMSKAMTNAEFMSPRFPLSKFDVMTIAPPMSRANCDLSDQFAYRYGVPEEGGGAAFLIQFRQSTVMLVTVYEDREEYLQRREVKYQSAVNLSPTAPRPESAIPDENVR